MTLVRAAALSVMVVLAVVLQTSVFSLLAVDGVAPTVLLLLVVAAGLVRGSELAAVLGFLGGLALDLAPPADHVAGRWALALVVVGYLAGRTRGDAGPSVVGSMLTVAACSFVGTSLFAFSGMLLGDGSLAGVDALRVIGIATAYDVVLAPLVLPLALRVLRGLEPRRVAF